MAVRVRGAQVVGRLNLGGLTLRCPMELYECYLGGRLDLAKSKAADISLRGSYLTRRLSARRLRLDHNLNLQRLDCRGGVWLPGAHITGQLDCTGAALTNEGGWALSGDSLTVDGHLLLRTATFTGEVWLPGAHISGTLDCDGATLRSRTPDGLALGLLRASVDGDVYMTPAVLRGGIDLTYARVGSWYDNERSWPAWLRLKGFTYGAIDAPGVGVRRRLDWLSLQRGAYTPQSYEQLAAVYRRSGHEGSAPTVAIAKQRARRASSRRWWVRWPRQVWSVFLRWSIGYGYRPARVLPYFVTLLVLGSLILAHAHTAGLIKAAKTGSGQPAFHPLPYTLDLLLPVANLKQRDVFTPDGYATWWVLGLTLTGWLLAVVVVAGLTGIFKRD
jgi:hypothetical protein